MSVEFRDNSAAAMAQFERNKAKCLEMLGLKWQELAVKEATDQGIVDTGRFRSSLSYVTPERESGRNMSQLKKGKNGMEPKSEPSDALSGGAIRDAVKVGSNVEYAQWIENGTSRMPARPVIEKSVTNHRNDYREIVKDTLGEGFDVK